ncbi:MAG: hypothetical protein ACI8VC_001844 [Candidatus Endobugula sp.]|jgi:hypothetical protein
MKDIKKIFHNLEEKLKQSNWFEDEWKIYNRGAYLQLYKVNWHNHNQGGIHFETYIEAPQIKQKAFPICMHAEEDCQSQSEFIQKFLALEGDRIKSWKGYQAGGKNYNICQRTLPLNFKNLEQRLFDEFNRLRQLESGVEQALRTL